MEKNRWAQFDFDVDTMLENKSKDKRRKASEEEKRSLADLRDH